MIFLGSKLVGALRSYATFLFDGAARTVVPEPTRRASREHNKGVKGIYLTVDERHNRRANCG